MDCIERLISLFGEDLEHWEGDTDDLCNAAIDAINKLRYGLQQHQYCTLCGAVWAADDVCDKGCLVGNPNYPETKAQPPPPADEGGT